MLPHSLGFGLLVLFLASTATGRSIDAIKALEARLEAIYNEDNMVNEVSRSQVEAIEEQLSSLYNQQGGEEDMVMARAKSAKGSGKSGKGMGQKVKDASAKMGQKVKDASSKMGQKVKDASSKMGKAAKGKKSKTA